MTESDNSENPEYVAALAKAKRELDEIEYEQDLLERRKQQLLQCIAMLGPLSGRDFECVYGIGPGAGLTEAIRIVAQYSCRKGEALTPTRIRDLLTEQGYSLAKHKNHMASIHTAMKRMCQSGEFESANNGAGCEYYWVGSKKDKEQKSASTPRKLSFRLAIAKD